MFALYLALLSGFLVVALLTAGRVRRGRRHHRRANKRFMATYKAGFRAGRSVIGRTAQQARRCHE